MAAGVQIAISHDDNTTPLKDYTNVVGTVSYSAANGRNGSASMRMSNGGGQVNYASKTLPTVLTQIRQAFSFRVSIVAAGGTKRIIARITDNTVSQVQLMQRSDGTFQFERGTSGVVLGVSSGITILANTVYHGEWEVVMSGTVGTLKFWINEVLRASLTGLNTQGVAGSNNISTADLVLNDVTGGATACTIDFDDHVVRDDQQIGDREVLSLLPNGTGATDQWIPVGAATTYQAVNENPPNDDTSYAKTSVVNDKSTWTYPTIATTSTIDAVVPCPYVKKTDAGTAKHKAVIRQGGADFLGVEKAPSDGAYEYHPDVFMLNPNTGLPFTPAEWNAGQVGIQRTG